MGKHDKKEEQVTTFSWKPMPDEWYKARIDALEKENLKLAKALKKAERFGNVMEKLTDPENGSYVSRAEYEELVEKFEAMEDRLIEEIDLNENLKDALVRAALREEL